MGVKVLETEKNIWWESSSRNDGGSQELIYSKIMLTEISPNKALCCHNLHSIVLLNIAFTVESEPFA